MSINDDCIKFGMLVIEKGYITEGQLGIAVSQQMKEDIQGKPHRRLGEILMSMELINEVDLINLLNDMKKAG